MFDELTDEQQAAVDHDGGNLLIVAGAGTGKTTTLAARLATLVAGGVSPERVMLLTFSRRAATELVSRADVWVGHDRLRGARARAARCDEGAAGAERTEDLRYSSLPSRSCMAGTFHSVANRLLRRYGRAVGIEPDATLLDPADTAELMALVRDEHAAVSEPTTRRARKEVLVSVLSRVVNTRTPLDVVVRTNFPWVSDQLDDLRATYGAYVAHKRAHHLVDYDDLLTLWRALVLDETAGRFVAERFDHILVDEYQDTNVVQADILAALAGHGVTITAVGDDAQAIYGFRGGTVRNILDFPATFGAEVITLTRNHRSTPEVVDVANRIWAEATERHAKDLVSQRRGGERPELVTSGDEHVEARAVCERIVAAHERGIGLRRQAVLFRTSHHADVLEIELTVRKIPYVKFGGLAFLEAAHVKDLLALCRVVVNPRDDLAWFRILQRVDGVGPGLARRFVAALDPADGDLSAVASGGVVPDRLTDDVAALASAVAETARIGSSPGDAPVRLDRLLEWLDPSLDRFGDGDARRADLARLADIASQATSLERFLTELTLDPPASTSDLAGPPVLDDDYVTLSTIHSAKGGEWDIVHLIHAADGNLPSDLATGDPAQIEEERRLLYVAATRARDQLSIHVPLRFHHHPSRRDDAHSMAQRSRFLTPTVVAAMRDVVNTGPTTVDVTTGEIVGHGAAVERADADLAALLA